MEKSPLIDGEVRVDSASSTAPPQRLTFKQKFVRCYSH